jgi:hypothetical protein
MVSESDTRNVAVLTDELWPEQGTDWLYLGSCFIDNRFLDDVCNAFLNARYDRDGWKTVRNDTAWQDATPDDTVVTFDDCNRTAPYEVAHRWLSLLRQRFAVTNQVRIKITGINRNQLDLPDDTQHQYRDIYDNVLRDHLIDARSHFFGDSIHVNDTDCYKRKSDTERNTAFEHVMNTVNDQHNDIGTLTVRDAEHTTHTTHSQDWQLAHLLQLLNVVTGGVANLFTAQHLPHRQAKLSWLQKDLVQKSMEYEQPAVDRFTVSFYPNTKDNHDNEFYYWRDIQRTDPHKQTLE